MTPARLVAGFYAAALGLWLLALWDMLRGNPTAINGVVGIPLGGLAAAGIIYAWTRPLP